MNHHYIHRLIPRIVSGAHNPGYKWDFCGGNVHLFVWGELTHNHDSWDEPPSILPWCFHGFRSLHLTPWLRHSLRRRTSNHGDLLTLWRLPELPTCWIHQGGRIGMGISNEAPPLDHPWLGRSRNQRDTRYSLGPSMPIIHQIIYDNLVGALELVLYFIFFFFSEGLKPPTSLWLINEFITLTIEC